MRTGVGNEHIPRVEVEEPKLPRLFQQKKSRILGNYLTAEGGSQQSGEPVIYVDPSEILNYSLKAKDTFSIDINIANVTDLLGYDFRLKFNSNILNATSVVAWDFFGETLQYGIIS